MVKIITTLLFMMAHLLLISTHAEARVVSHIVINGTGLYEDGRNDKNEERECISFKPTLKEITKIL